MSAPSVVLDTNIFIAAAFRPDSDSARLLEAVRRGDLRLVWNQATRRETETLLRKIPPVSWADSEDLFEDQHQFTGEVDPTTFGSVPDPDDRKFAALAAAAKATLVTLDSHLLDAKLGEAVPVLTPSDFLKNRARE